jgi:PPOX class probable F420-dependent enzyme
MQIDTSSPFGTRVQDRLNKEIVGWLTTAGKDGTPHPRPVWFLWDGEAVLIFSQPNTFKLTHIARNPRIAFNLDGDGKGGNIVVLTGSATIDDTAPTADRVPEFVEKYKAEIPRIGMTPESFAASYSVAVRFIPEKLSGH